MSRHESKFIRAIKKAIRFIAETLQILNKADIVVARESSDKSSVKCKPSHVNVRSNTNFLPSIFKKKLPDGIPAESNTSKFYVSYTPRSSVPGSSARFFKSDNITILPPVNITSKNTSRKME